MMWKWTNLIFLEDQGMLLNYTFGPSLTENRNSFFLQEFNNVLVRTFSCRNVHFNHLSFHLHNYHANASSITWLECHFLYCKVYYVFGETLTSIALPLYIFWKSLLTSTVHVLCLFLYKPIGYFNILVLHNV